MDRHSLIIYCELPNGLSMEDGHGTLSEIHRLIAETLLEIKTKHQLLPKGIKFAIDRGWDFGKPGEGIEP